MEALERDPQREERIAWEIVPDAHDDEERALGWFEYLQDRLHFPFTAVCTAKRATSPLRVGEEVEVIDLPHGNVCRREIFVIIRWGEDGLAVPLSQLKPVAADEETREAVEDWRYWVAQGNEF